MSRTAEIYCALDTPDLDRAEALARVLAPHIDGVKLGLEFFAAHGPAGVSRVAGTGLPVFLDLKLHDIPNTVAGAVRALEGLPVSLLTIHASGGAAMIRAAAGAVDNYAPDSQRPAIIAVTVLTSLDAGDLGKIGIERALPDAVMGLADLAAGAGAGGIVCSPREVAAVKARHPDLTSIVPGIRPEGAARGDQKRVMTPREAQEAGADTLVIGRAITGADDPAAAAAAIRDSLA